MDLDRYAEISAHLRHFPADKKDEVVGRLGLRARDWQAAATRWSRDLEASADSGRADLVQRYSAAFSRTKRRLASLRPSIESLGPLPEPDPAEAVPDLPAPAFADLPEPAEPQVAVPSYLSNPSDSGPALPAFMKGQAPVRLEPAPAMVEPAPAMVAPVPAIVAPAPVPVEPAAVTTAPAAVTTAPAAVPKAPAPRGRTMAMPAMPVPVHELPFTAEETSAEEAVERAVAHASAVQGPPRDSPIPLGATVDIGAIARGPLPPPRAAARPIPTYTVERYASLKIELREYASRAADVLARYKLDPETAAALEEDWNRRMNIDSALRSRFLDACERYRAWLRSRDGNKR